MALDAGQWHFRILLTICLFYPQSGLGWIESRPEQNCPPLFCSAMLRLEMLRIEPSGTDHLIAMF
jgi:hypothetical protein